MTVGCKVKNSNDPIIHMSSVDPDTASPSLQCVAMMGRLRDIASADAETKHKGVEKNG